MPGTKIKRRQRRMATAKHRKRVHLKSRREREEYVRHVSVTGKIHIPFWDEEHYNAAIAYIETGDEALKDQFPSIFRR